ncbi:PDZ and LIM domain protein Zasp-like [Chrysoperla carnea]|uniref:PDZ and LIM domain protein Zasp-like n=1 Tax=Chrysoperla carnea TaxID=189513 RepID=UPI001D096E62|nr:PDZ and LIM domain protein Zasp-like [Chrysoperla carnea]
MAQLISVRLQRTDNTPWGFRLQGGKDFGSPLVIQKVNGNSIAERAGLQAGDAVLRVNSSDVFNLRHKEAQDTIVRAGPNFEITVQRGSQTWKPTVIPTGTIPTPSPHINNNVTVTKTSLVSNTPPQKPIGTGHNVQPKPFLNGNSDLKLVNKQYNSPMALYSEESIAETLSAQTEVLPTGALGVNFKKNERSYNAEKSEVLKMLQEAENDPKDAEPENNEHQGVVTSPAPVNVAGLRHVTAPITAPPSQTSANKSGLQPGQNICADCERLIEIHFLYMFFLEAISSRSEFYSHASHAIGGRATSPRPLTPLAQKMGVNQSTTSASSTANITSLTPPPSHRPSLPITQDSPICTDCERVIVGVFVRIKDKNLHVECFKCSTCGTSLKNVGYYNINNKLYCDIHAKLAARSNQPGPNLVPVTIPPGGKIPAGTISAALASHPLPSAGPLSPSSNSSGPLPPYSILNTTTNNFDENLSKIDDVVDYSHSKLKSDTPKLNVDHVKTFANNLIMKETPQFNNNNDLNNKLNRKFDEVNNSDKKVYLTEAKINVNNDLIIENGLNNRFEKVIDLNNEIKKKPSSSVLSGPRPFSSNAAPLSPLSPVSAPTNAAPFSNHAATLPRAATQNLPASFNNSFNSTIRPFSSALMLFNAQQQYSSEIIEQTIVETSESTSVEQTIDSNKSTCLTWPPPRTDEEVPTATPLYVPPSPSNPVLVRPPRSLSQTRDQIYTAETGVTEHREFSQKEETSQFTEQSEQTKQEYRKVTAPGIRVTSEDESIANAASGQPKMSICSAEVQDINTGRRSTTECAENIVETVDTQRLVESIKEQYDRPPSPPPPGLLEEEICKQKEKIFGKTGEAESKPSINKVEEVTNIAKKVVDDVQKQLQNVAKQVDIVQKKLENAQENKFEQTQAIEKNTQQCVQQSNMQQSSVQKSSVQQSFEQVQNFQQISQTSQVYQKSAEVNIQSSNLQEIPPPAIPQNICSNNPLKVCSQVCENSNKTICTEVENLQQSCLRQQQSSEKVEISSNISNPVPKAWTSPLVTALTTASSAPFSTLSTSESYISQQNEQSTVELTYPHSDGKVAAQSSSLLTSGLTIAPERPFTPVPPVSNEPVPLPEMTEPYFPPEISKDPIPRAPEKFDPKTPMLDALTTAPLRKYTPVTKEVIAQQDDLMKDLPPGPYPQIDLLGALTTAPERPFTPIWGMTSVNVSSEPTAPPAQGKGPTAQTAAPPKPKKQHTDFKPAVPKIVAESIKPPTYKPPEVPVVKSFPPVSNELKCTFKPSTEFGASKIIQSSTQQGKDFVSKEFHSEEREFYKSSSVNVVSATEAQINTTASCTKPQTRPVSGLHEATQIPAYQQNLQNISCQKSKESTTQRKVMSAEHSEDIKVGTLKTQSQQYSLHKPDSIPSYQRGISPVGVRKAEPPHFDILKDGKEHDKVVAKEYCHEISQKTVEPLNQEVQELRRSEAVAQKTWKPIQAIQSVPPQPISQQLPSVSITQATTQKVPIQTIQPGEIPPNIPTMSFQPVVDTSLRPATPSSARPARAVTPSLINKPAPIIPYYQMSLIPTEHLAPETNLYDPKSPDISRAPTPRLDRAKSPSGRAQSPFPRARTPVPAGPPPSPLRAHAPRVKPEPDPSVKKEVSYVVTQAANYLEDQAQKKQVQFQQSPPRGSLTTNEFSENIKAQTANLRAQATTQQKSVETLSGGLVQVQRKKTVTEEFERTRKQVDIERATSSSRTTINQTTSENAPFVRQLSVESAHGTKTYETSSGKPVQIPSPAFKPPAPQENLKRPKPIGGVPTPFSGSSAFNPVQTKPSGLPTPKPIAPVPTSVPPGFKPLAASGTSFPKPESNVPKPFSGSSAFKTFAPKPSECCGGPPCQSTGLSACAALIKPSASIALAPVVAPTTSSIPSTIDPLPNAGAVGANAGPKFGGGAVNSKGKQAGAVGVAPRRGRGILNKAAGFGARAPPLCGHCNAYVRGPFITALGKIWCPEHFICATPSCRRPLQDLGFVEERGQLYCEYCFEQYLAPTCDQCHSKVKGDCLKAIGKHFHPDCFKCGYCGKMFGNNPFFLEDGLPYCEADWNELFTTKCFACGFPVEAGDRWVEALNNNYHSQCFNCTMCKKNLEGQSFYAKGGRPFCKNHAR